MPDPYQLPPGAVPQTDPLTRSTGWPAPPQPEPSGGDGLWERIQMALKQGLISNEQFQQMSAKMGYTPQNVGQTPPPAQQPMQHETQHQVQGKLGGNFSTGVKEPNYSEGQNLAGKLGQTAGEIAGRLGTAAYKRMTAPAAPGAPLDISGGGVNPPSPAWNN